MSLWQAVIINPGYLSRSIRQFKPSVETFCVAKKKAQQNNASALDMIVVSRLSHGGRGTKGGPQGGHDQSGKYKIDCRWNPEKLCKTVDQCHELLTSIPCRYYCKDYETLLDLDTVYLDPPYYDVGNTLYQYGFKADDHSRLSNQLQSRDNWILSYNNNPKIRHLYRQQQLIVATTAGNGGIKSDSELIILPNKKIPLDFWILWCMLE